MPPRVSFCLIARNEEANLPICLASTADLFAETIVVDTGSTDRTREVAAELGARVFSFEWVDSFAAARNESLRHASGEWIFCLDADEHLDEANREKLWALLRGLGANNVCYAMQVRSRVVKSRQIHAAVGRVCLFRNHPEHRWRYRVHEQILPALQSTGASLCWADIAIEHSGYEDSALGRRKMERNLRLLELEHEENPNDPFILFYLGWTHLDLGRAADALPLLRRAQENVGQTAPYLPWLFALEVHCAQQLGRQEEAAAICEAGRARFPADAMLLFEEALLRRRRGDLRETEACLGQLLNAHPPAGPLAPELQPIATGHSRFAPTLEGVRGYLARHHLALLWFEQGRLTEAEAGWRAVLDEQPAFAPAEAQLGELFLAQRRWTELGQSAATLENEHNEPVPAALLRARAHLAHGAFAEARLILEETIAGHPDEIWPRVILTQTLLQQGQEETAEKALRDVVQRDPSQLESWCNLAKLLRNQDRLDEAAAVCDEGRQHFPDEPNLLRIQGLTLHELDDLGSAETCLARFLALQSGKQALAGEEQARITAVRHNLAQVLRKQERLADAEAQWQALLAETPAFTAAWLELGNLFLAQQRWQELEQVAERLEAEFQLAEEAAYLRVQRAGGGHRPPTHR